MKSLVLTQGKVALVSDDDYAMVAPFKWIAQCGGKIWYARLNFPGGYIFMHQLLAGFPPFRLDHRNRNGLDNRRSNLRPATSSQNGVNTRRFSNNTSGFRGVSLHKPSGLWRACFQGKTLGYFKSPLAASRLRNKTAKKLFGEFAAI